MDSVEANRAFAEKHAFPFKLLCDTDRAIAMAYGAVDDPNGIARRISYVIGPDGKIVAAHGKVHVKTHASDVLAQIPG